MRLLPRNYSGINVKSVHPEPILTTQTFCPTFCFKGETELQVLGKKKKKGAGKGGRGGVQSKYKYAHIKNPLNTKITL